MPFKARRPAGGFRVIYEYANRLSDLGYSVHITFPLRTPFMKYRFPYWMRWLMSRIEGFRTDKWFDFRPSIMMSYVKEIKEEYVIDADIVIATWWATVLEMGRLSMKKGRKINFIQGFEDWEGHIDLLYSSYNIPKTINIVVASYLKEIVQQYTKNQVILIPNAIDSEQFFIKNAIENRNPYSVCMNYSIQEIKGSKYGFNALLLLKEKYPQLKVNFFGICPKPEKLPEWITYHRNPNSLCDIYNNSAIFISNSLTEGFGLVSVESMYCGCALVCTDIDGHKEYAIDGETALLVEPQNIEDMFMKIDTLISNSQKRISLAHKGNAFVARFSWNSAVDKMNSVIQNLLQV